MGNIPSQYKDDHFLFMAISNQSI